MTSLFVECVLCVLSTVLEPSEAYDLVGKVIAIKGDQGHGREKMMLWKFVAEDGVLFQGRGKASWRKCSLSRGLAR